MIENLKGNLSISRVSTTNEGNYITIELEDETSGIQVLQIKASLEEIALALFGLSCRPVDYELTINENIGKQHENKTLPIPIPETTTYRDKGFPDALRKAVEPFEVDGWKADIDRTWNQHRFNHKDCTYEVIFRRWVAHD